MRVSRGDVILVPFPYSSFRRGVPRPALVIQANDLQTGIAQFVVAMITSNMTRAGHPSRTTILVGTLDSQKAGLLVDSVVMTDSLAALQEQEVLRSIGFLDSLPMADVDTALRHTLGLN